MMCAYDMQSLDGWIDFYENSNKYFYAGKVNLPAIPANSPIPEDCRNQKK